MIVAGRERGAALDLCASVRYALVGLADVASAVAGSLGTFAGLETNENAQVLGADDMPIAGLYAAGNDMASVMGGHYPSGGITLGPAMTFGYIAARDMVGAND